MPDGSGGFKDNVIPDRATAIVNHRIHPADDIGVVLDHDRAAIDDDRVSIRVLEHMSASATAPFDNEDAAFQVVANSVLEVYPDSAVVPSLLIGQTDGKHYEWITSRIYRFTPSYLGVNDGNMWHGANERIAVDSYANTVRFYDRLIANAAYNIKSNGANRANKSFRFPDQPQKAKVFKSAQCSGDKCEVKTKVVPTAAESNPGGGLGVFEDEFFGEGGEDTPEEVAPNVESGVFNDDFFEADRRGDDVQSVASSLGEEVFEDDFFSNGKKGRGRDPVSQSSVGSASKAEAVIEQ